MKALKRRRQRNEEAMEVAQVILVLGIVVGLIAFLFPTITSAINERGQTAKDQIAGTSFQVGG